MRRWNKAVLLLLAGLFLTLAACGVQETYVEGEREYRIYYLNKAETKISDVSFYTNEKDTEKLLDLLMGQLQQTPEDTELRATIPESMELKEYFLSEGLLTVNFGDGYRQQTPTTEVLARAAVVRTLCQLEDVSYVTYTIDREALMNRSGSPVGVMNADLFVENTGSEINAYEKAFLTLYFADNEGTGLKKVTREEVYSSNISMEKLVVDKVITGPAEDEADVYPTINPNTKVLSVTVKDGICYVNLDGAFQTQVDGVAADVTVYSLVNSLVELNNINKVQISIEGETKIVYKEQISLENPLERNFEIVKE
ncbi:MAG: GerMN domain-containing protein [Lachnospiraceae bacterium]|nr:GerMN domain-containing protein [Lachnospiraceae bacterium]